MRQNNLISNRKKEFKMKFRVLSRANAIKFAKEPHDYKTIIISISNSYEYNKKLIHLTPILTLTLYKFVIR